MLSGSLFWFYPVVRIRLFRIQNYKVSINVIVVAVKEMKDSKMKKKNWKERNSKKRQLQLTVVKSWYTLLVFDKQLPAFTDKYNCS